LDITKPDLNKEVKTSVTYDERFNRVSAFGRFQINPVDLELAFYFDFTVICLKMRHE
jgi:hypothetical protein